MVGDVVGDERAQPLARRRGRGDGALPRLEQLLHHAGGDPVQELLLARVVVVEAPRLDADGGGDLTHRGRVVPLRVEERGCRLEDPILRPDLA